MYQCVNCNLEYGPNSEDKCKKCDQTIDIYAKFERGILMLDMILCKVQAYRHLQKNIYNSLSSKQILISFIGVIIVLIILDENSSCLQISKEILVQFILICIFFDLKKKKVTYYQLIWALLIAQFGRLAKVLFIIWDHQEYNKSIGMFSIIVGQLTTIRGLFEKNNEWITSTIITTISWGTLQLL